MICFGLKNGKNFKDIFSLNFSTQNKKNVTPLLCFLAIGKKEVRKKKERNKRTEKDCRNRIKGIN